MALSFRDLIDRRVPQYLAIYLGAGWGLVEFCSFLEGRASVSLSPVVTDIVLFTWALLIPGFLLFVFFHGRPGRDRWTRAELVGIPLNVVLAIFVLTSAFGGADLSATTTAVTVTDESGNEVERRIANASYRKRLAIFDFDAAPGDTAVAWLRQGAPLALATDLAQDLFLDLRTPAHFREKLREASAGDGRNVPLTLKRRIAEELHLPWFLTGTVSSGIEGTTVRVELYETATGRRMGERVSTTSDVLDAIDELSVQLKTDLGLPQSRPGGVQDLPVVELLSPDPYAFRALVEAQNAAMRDDWEGAQGSYTRATQLDSTFALAHYALYSTRLVRGDAAGSMSSLDAAMRHLYRMPERLQFLVKTDHYFMRRDMDKAFAVVGMMVELYPDDLQGHAMHAQFQVFRNDHGGAIESLRRILELDPQQHEVLLQIGSLEEQLGEYADAIATYEQYSTAFPSDVGARLRVARAHLRIGGLDDARAAVEQALVVDPTSIEATLERAILHRDVGELDAAARLIDDAGVLARTAEDRARVEQARQSYHDFRGQTALTIQAMQNRLAAISEYQPPVQQANMRMSQLGAYVRAGQAALARAHLDEVRRIMNAPLDDFWRMGQLEIAVAERDTMVLPEALAGVTRVMEQFDFNFLAANIARGEATLLEARGDLEGALVAYRKFLALEPGQTTANRDIARMLRLLGRLDDARSAIESHLLSVPYAPESNVEAARIRIASGDTAAARAHLERTIAMLASADAGHATALEARRMLAELER